MLELVTRMTYLNSQTTIDLRAGRQIHILIFILFYTWQSTVPIAGSESLGKGGSFPSLATPCSTGKPSLLSADIGGRHKLWNCTHIVVAAVFSTSFFRIAI